ncbi:apoptosis-inducing factor A [Ceratobasidium sp. AG-Ba]|nr:apoptosis-inducing factor A [Ceratobasidium sp. AG-Ba]
MSSVKNIVVVGTGGGGLTLVQTLQKQINQETHRIVVIEKRDYYAHWPALIRAAVTDEGAIDENGLVPYDRAFDPSVRVVRSTAKEINRYEVITESGESIPYEHLVLATGSVWSGALDLPDTRKAAIEHLRSFKQQIRAAHRILIVGGGSVGIEYAGELRHYFPEKTVSLIHGGKELMNKTYPAKFRRSILDALQKIGVEVVLGDKISPNTVPEEGYVTTEHGQRIQTDMVIVATGGRLNTDVVRTLDSSIVAQTGTVLVTPELNVKLPSGAKNVWAIGDIIEWPEQKMVFKASRGHAPVVAQNIIAAIQGGKTVAYLGKPEMIFVTIGPKGGRGLAPFFGGIVIGDWIVSKLKSGELFVGKARAALGY